MYSNIDYVAERLIKVGRVGRNMPPAWDGGKIKVPVKGPQGQYVGQLLPGRGLLLGCDLKALGIRKPLPYVLEKTPMMKLNDWMKSDRAAVAAAAMLATASLFSRSAILHLLGPALFGTVTTYDGIIQARAGGKANDVVFVRTSIASAGSGWMSLYDTGGQPDAGVFTGTPGAVLTGASLGSLGTGIPNVTGSDHCYILTFGFTAAQNINMAMLVDLLVQVGNLTLPATTTTVTISSVALTRYTTGAGVVMIFEVTTALPSPNAGTFTVSYTNQAGTAAQVSQACAMLSAAIVGKLMPQTWGPVIGLASGDYGVRAVASLTMTIAASAGTGIIGLNLYYPLVFVPGLVGNMYAERDSTIQIDGLVELQNASGTVGCPVLYVLPGTTTTGVLMGFIRTCAG